MTDKIIETIKNYNMLHRGANVIVALSGGADSMALLHFLGNNADALGISLEAVHVNHNIRGAEALRDQEFAREYCKDHGIKLTVFSKNIPGIAAESGESLEECGRRIRYELLESLDQDSLIATAHNLNDNAETSIFNLIRGAGQKGLCGIPPVRGRIIRPLIECAKEEILIYCESNHIPYITDSTNADNSYTRNKIRNTILPLFTEINPSFLTSFSRTRDVLSLNEEYIAQSAAALADKAFDGKGYHCGVLLGAHPAPRREAIALIVKSLCGVKGEYRHIIEIDRSLSSGGSVTVPGGHVIKSDGKILSAAKTPEEKKSVELHLKNLNSSYNINKKTVRLSIKTPDTDKSQKFNNMVFINLLDYDTIIGNVIIRSRKDGDKIKLSGRGCTKALKKLFNEAKIPPGKRDGLLMLEDELGIIWLETFGTAERCKVSANTKKTLEIELEARNEGCG